MWIEGRGDNTVPKRVPIALIYSNDYERYMLYGLFKQISEDYAVKTNLERADLRTPYMKQIIESNDYIVCANKLTFGGFKSAIEKSINQPKAIFVKEIREMKNFMLEALEVI